MDAEKIKEKLAELVAAGAFLPESATADATTLRLAPVGPSAGSYWAEHKLLSYKYQDVDRTQLLAWADGDEASLLKHILAEIVEWQGSTLVFGGGGYETAAERRACVKLLSTILDHETTAINGALSATKGRARNRDADYDIQEIQRVLDGALRDNACDYDLNTASWYREYTDASGKVRQIKQNLVDINALVDVATYAYKWNTGSKIPRAAVLAQLGTYPARTKAAKIKELADAILYTVDDDAFRVHYFTALHKVLKIEQSVELFVTILSHFIFRMKLGLYGRRRDMIHPIMVAIFGEQGIGKSSLLNALLHEVLGCFYNDSVTLASLTDERSAPLWENSLIINIEELAKDDGIDNQSKQYDKALAQLKKLLTGNKLTMRILGTNQHTDIDLAASVMSTANTHIYDVIQDRTGMRRFIEFTSAQPKGVHIERTEPDLYAFLTNQDNVLRMLRSINEDLPEGFLHPACPVWTELVAIQATYLKPTEFERYLEGTFEPNIDALKQPYGIRVSDIRKLYAVWREQEGLHGGSRPTPNTYQDEYLATMYTGLDYYLGSTKYFALKVKSDSVIKLEHLSERSENTHTYTQTTTGRQVRPQGI